MKNLKVDAAAIEQALRTAEQNTSAEILPVIARRSTQTGHVRLMLFLFCLSAILFVENYFGLIGMWLWVSPIVAGVLAFIFAPLHIFEQLFLSKADRLKQIHANARLMFFEQGLHKTAKGTGILLFISLKERFAIVLADEGIAKKVSPDVWKEVIKLLTDVARKEDITAGLCEAILLCGKISAEHFPAQSHNANEIPNRLIMME